ncbi:hypothetical protein BV372_08770 [Nostoc sp. T09]|uniref:hypothetical protein n=1 Tax=Nostoc sp. T09 TaxID=1932621 RepID=UPI000A37BB02|nr:hypothetical protein [Nostoc sp. T09]OUL35983.1 hypothetical protein BV372_08770 [Nostoc sp. T09]
MKVTVRDADILKTIEPQQLKHYLQSHGWHEDRPFLDNATVWLKQEPEHGEFEILLPNKQHLGDYPTRIQEALKILEEVENRSQIEILSELITNASNITIQGVVMQIEAPNADQLSAEITLLGVVFDKLRLIKTELADHEYILAIKAYQERLPVLCTGDLIKENNTFILKNSRQFILDNP